MKTKLLLFSGLFFFLGLAFSSCGDDEPVVDDNGGETSDKGSITVLVSRKANDKFYNNYGCLVVLGKHRDSMAFLKYKTGKLPDFDKQKVYLEQYNDLKSTGKIMDTMYSRINAGLEPNTEKKIGAIIFDELEPGTYYIHVLDGNRDKYVAQVSVTVDNNTQVIAKTQRLGHLKVVTAQSSVGGENIDDSDVRLYGATTDTLNSILSGSNPSEISFSPYYQGVTTTRRDENGYLQSGILFFLDIPARKYYVAAYHDSWTKDNSKQPYSLITVRQNLLGIEKLSLQ